MSLTPLRIFCWTRFESCLGQLKISSDAYSFVGEFGESWIALDFFGFALFLKVSHCSGKIAELVSIISVGYLAMLLSFTSPLLFAGLYLICLCSTVFHVMSFLKISYHLYGKSWN